MVLWTNEENGLAGAKKYAEYHAHELPNHIAAIEADSGVFAPTGYSLECKNEGKAAIALEQIKQITDLIGSIGTLGALESKMGHGGADISPMKDAGVVLMGHRTEGSKYFDYHHSHADTLDKVDPVELSQNVAALAVMAYIIADMPERLGERSK